MNRQPHFCFLIATERSGSNFLTSLMNGHTRVSGPPPSHLFRLFGTNRGNYGDLGRDDAWGALIEDFVLSFESQLGEWRTMPTVDALREQASERSVAELLRTVYAAEAAADGATHVFVKENRTWSFVPFLLGSFPGSRFVLLVRDPRDVAASWVRTATMPGGVAKAVDVWTNDQRYGLSIWDQLRDTGRILLVSYEQLLADVVGTLTALSEHLGLGFEKEMLDFHRSARTRANAERIEAWANLKEPVMRSNAGKFREVLSSADQRYVELSCYELMTRLGYTPELVSRPQSAEGLESEVAALRGEVSPGTPFVPSAEERAIRERRLAAIDRVLNRRF